MAKFIKVLDFEQLNTQPLFLYSYNSNIYLCAYLSLDNNCIKSQSHTNSFWNFRKILNFVWQKHRNFHHHLICKFCWIENWPKFHMKGKISFNVSTYLIKLTKTKSQYSLLSLSIISNYRFWPYQIFVNLYRWFDYKNFDIWGCKKTADTTLTWELFCKSKQISFVIYSIGT